MMKLIHGLAWLWLCSLSLSAWATDPVKTAAVPIYFWQYGPDRLIDVRLNQQNGWVNLYAVAPQDLGQKRYGARPLDADKQTVALPLIWQPDWRLTVRWQQVVYQPEGSGIFLCSGITTTYWGRPDERGQARFEPEQKRMDGRCFYPVRERVVAHGYSVAVPYYPSGQACQLSVHLYGSAPPRLSVGCPEARHKGGEFDYFAALWPKPDGG